VCTLGLQDRLVARSHECNFPESVRVLPTVTAPKYSVEPGESSGDIQDKISYLLRNALSIYEVDVQLLSELRPDIILTQNHCEVCAVSESDLDQSVRKALGPDTEIISTSPVNIDTILSSFQQVSGQLGVPARGRDLVRQIQSRFDEIEKRTENEKKPTVVSVEWIDPLMAGGNWMPELVQIAGGANQLSTAGKHSEWIEWEAIQRADPDILLVVPCGYSISQTLNEMHALESNTGWHDLEAVRNNNVYILDGDHYFNRPGPRLKESAEILAHIFHPSLFKNREISSGWVQYNSETDQQHTATGSR
jgi:iron complex transport system substrate-binding protein